MRVCLCVRARARVCVCVRARARGSMHACVRSLHHVLRPRGFAFTLYCRAHLLGLADH